MQPLRPDKSKVQVIREFGWPLISKEVSDKIDALQHPTARNENFRHAIMTGEVGGADWPFSLHGIDGLRGRSEGEVSHAQRL